MSIPKKIHYVWVGGKKLPKLAQKCIDSWKTYLPDYEIIEWNENNFDITKNRYCYEAYKAKKYAFVSDYIRVYVLYTFGGIYMDTDVEVIQAFDPGFLEWDSFSGYETPNTIHTGVMGSVAGSTMFKKLLEYYDNAAFLNEDGSYNTETNVSIITRIAKEKGFVANGKMQTFLGCAFYPQTYFCPLCHDSSDTCFSEKTYTIHHFSGTWCDRKTRFVGCWNKGLKRKCESFFGKSISKQVYRVIYNVCRMLDKLKV